MNKKILFPFSFDRDFYRGYSWTMDLAVRLDATLYFFTSVPEPQYSEKDLLQKIYHSLLAARGNYLQYFHTPTKERVIAKTERLIEKGDLSCTLTAFVKKNKFDIVVVDPIASGLTLPTIYDVVENSDGVIVLPAQNEMMFAGQVQRPEEIEKNRTKDFYDVLQQSDLYKLQNNFFRTLGRDRTLFNYLHYFFRKKKHPDS